MRQHRAQIDISSLAALRASIARAVDLGWESSFAADLAVAIAGELSFGKLNRTYGHRMDSGSVAEHSVADVWSVLRNYPDEIMSAENPLGYIKTAVSRESVEYFMKDEGYHQEAVRRAHVDRSRYRVETHSLDGLIEGADPFEVLDCKPLGAPVDRARLGLSVEDLSARDDADTALTPVLSRFVEILRSAGLPDAAEVVSALTFLAAERQAVQRRSILKHAEEQGLAARLGITAVQLACVIKLMYPRDGDVESASLLFQVARSEATGAPLRISQSMHSWLTRLKDAAPVFEGQVIPLPPLGQVYEQAELFEVAS